MGTLNAANVNLTGNLSTPNRPIFSLGGGNGLDNSTAWTSNTIFYNSNTINVIILLHPKSSVRLLHRVCLY